MASMTRTTESIAWPTLLVLTFVGFGVFTAPDRLRSSRPAERAQASTLPSDGPNIESRVWQDPLDALYERDQNGVTTKRREVRWTEQVTRMRTCLKTPEQPGLLLPVLIDGHRYAETAEQRRRTRYAVLSGLAVAGYEPVHAGTLGVLPRGRGSKAPRPLGHGSSAVVAFEAFRLAPPPPPTQPGTIAPPAHVIVLWVNEVDFPLYKQGELDAFLKRVANAIDTGERTPIRVLGPSDSDGLISLLGHDPPKAGSRNSPAGLEGIEIMCSRATIGRDDLHRILSAPPGNGRTRVAAAQVRRTTPDDARLSELLIEELRLRGVEPGKGRVALVAEWDTSYSRHLCGTFGDAWRRVYRARNGLCPGAEVCNAVNPFTYFYFRGADGEGADGADRGAPAGGVALPGVAPVHAPGVPEKRAVIERATGESQLDYMRRLVERVRTDESSLGEVRAIGIVGTDVYDKLLVLQALRSSFPGVLFFTTDLDARLADPGEYRWARNLLVASPYDLRASRDIQRYAPVFRDSYQTAVFLDTLRAVRHKPLRDAEGEAPESQFAGLGGVWEIGRSGFRSLTRKGDNLYYPEERDAGVPRWAHRPWLLYLAAIFLLLLFSFMKQVTSTRRESVVNFTLHERGRAYRVGPRAVGVAVGLLTLLAIGRGGSLQPAVVGVGVAHCALIIAIPFFVHRLIAPPPARTAPPAAGQDGPAARGREEATPASTADRRAGSTVRREWALLLSWWWVGCVLLALAMAFVLLASSTEEPFVLFDGISVWPTVLLRCLVILLSFYYVLMLLRRWGINTQEIRERYRMSGPPKQGRPAAGAPWRVRWRKWRSACMIMGWGPTLSPQGGSSAEGIIEAGAVWQGYLLRAAWWPRVARTLMVTVPYFILCAFLFFGFNNPPAPYRGGAAFAVEQATVLAAAFATSFLTFFVWDAIRLSNRFIRNLSDDDRPSEYETDPVAACGRIRGLDAPDAASWLDVSIIADLTEAVVSAVYFPLVLLFIMIAARNDRFDNWTWPAPLLVVLFLGVVITLLGAYTLDRAAVHARDAETARLSAARWVAQRTTTGGGKARAERLKELIDEIRSVHRGAFRGWKENPILVGWLIPAGGLASIYLVELLATRL